MVARTQTLTVRYYGVDLYLEQEDHKPHLRKVLQVGSTTRPRSSELVQEVMLLYEIPFVARAEVEQLEGVRVVASVTCRNVQCVL